jgi:AcrR family transcriptional regulator
MEFIDMENQTTGKMRGRPREFSEEQALDAATQLFGEKGFEGASLSDLCEAMGINRPSMYATFGNKEDLYCKAVERYMVVGEQHIAECLSASTTRDGVDRLMRDVVLQFTDTQGPGVCFITQKPLTSPEVSDETQQYFAQRRTTLEVMLRHKFERALESGELPPDASPEDLARFYSVMVQGIALQAQHGGTREQLLRVVDVAMEQWPRGSIL